MTLKSSFFNLAAENIKHRIGILFAVFFSFFAYMIGFAINVQNIYSDRKSGVPMKNIRVEILEKAEPGMTLGVFVIALAFFLAVSSLRYLHVRAETDFYHALPVTRKRELLIATVSDLVMFLPFFVAVLILRCAVVAAFGWMTLEFLRFTLLSLICYLAVYAVTYLFAQLAMLMTGNTFVAVLGFGVFSLYFPGVIRNLYPSMAAIFFNTYAGDFPGASGFYSFSPLSLSAKLLYDSGVWKWENHWKYFVVMCVWTAALAVLNLTLAERRPSERAGRAMAFPKCNAVIRILIVVPTAILLGVFFCNATFQTSKGWILAGTMIGGILFHGIIECIYQFDIRGLWSHKKQMGLTILLSFVVVAFFWFDLGGYDKWIPSGEQLDAVLVEAPGMGVEEESYWGKERTGVPSEEADELLKTLKEVAVDNDSNIEKCRDEIPQGFESYIVEYRMKNGKTKRRNYMLDLEHRRTLMGQLLATKEFRKDSCSLYTADWSLVKNIQVDFPIGTRELNLTKEQRSKLFHTYLEEQSKLDFDSVYSQVPFGRLCVTHDAPKTGEGSDYLYSSSDVYYLYPRFVKTTALLEEYTGQEIRTSLKDFKIKSLSLGWYGDDDEFVEKEITDQEFLDEIKGGLYNIAGVSGVFEAVDYSMDITAEIETEDGVLTVELYADRETGEKLRRQ